MSNPATGRMRTIKGVHWHFLAHGGGRPPFNSLGVNPDLLQCLIENNIKFTVHFPAN
jgi:hypothetical protein